MNVWHFIVGNMTHGEQLIFVFLMGMATSCFLISWRIKIIATKPKHFLARGFIRYLDRKAIEELTR